MDEGAAVPAGGRVPRPRLGLPEDRSAPGRRAAQRQKWFEIGTAWAGTMGVLLALSGMAAVFYGNRYGIYGVLLLALGVGAMMTGQGLSFNINTYRFIGSTTRGSERYERLHRWNRLKTSSALHSLLVMFGALLLLVAVLSRLDVVQIALSGHQGDRAMAMFLAFFIINSAYAHHQSLFIALDADRTGGTRVLFWVGTNAAILLGGFAAYINYYQVNLVIGALALRPEDALVILVAAYTLQGVLLSVSRGLPSIFSIMADPRTQSRGGYISRTKAVAMPTIVAFTLLLVFVLLIVIFGAGIFTVLNEVGRSPSVVAILGIMVTAVVAGLGLSLFLVRQEDKVELYRPLRSREQRVQTLILAISLTVAAILLAMAFMANREGGLGPFAQDRWLHFASLGLLTALGPYGFYAARRHKHIQQMETRFPDLLRDLASSHKGGLTLVQSAQVAARGEYGALTPEIQRLADQLTWNVSFDEAFSRFADRVATPLVERSVNLVLEAGRSGGNTTDVLLAAARDAREIKSLERERTLNMGVYTTVIYVTFFVFLFVIGVMVAQFLPGILEAGEAAGAEDSTLDAEAAGINLGGINEDDYRQFYFIAGAVQAIGNGMLAGIMGSGKTSLGLRHAFFMVFVTYIAFGFFL